MLDSASVNSISSIPSPVYQCKKAFLLNIAVNYSATLLNISYTAVELPTKVTAIFNPLGGISQMEDFMLLGIHSTK
jgi:phosphoglycerol transferase MdoB-like AlkP superfamily enzyme